jgi:hypothetical protein
MAFYTLKLPTLPISVDLNHHSHKTNKLSSIDFIYYGSTLHANKLKIQIAHFMQFQG